MKTSLFAAAAFALATMSAAHAAPQVLGDAADSVQIHARANYKVAPNEFNDYEYAYRLDDGKVIKFSQRVTSFYVQLKGEPKVQIFARAPGVFVTEAGARMEFRDAGETVAISRLERLPMAQAMPASDRVYVAAR
ncbi:MAG: gel scht [Pseudomonadota bacterium]